MKMAPDDATWFAGVRDEWLRRFRPASTLLGQHLFHVPARLTQPAVESARVFAHRLDALGFFPRGGRVAEVGTQAGWFAERLCEQLAPQELHLFDLTDELLMAERPSLLERPGVRLHLGDSSTELGRFADGYFDWIYIDGDHTLEGVRKDTEVAVGKVRPDGVLVFNDYTPWSVMEFTDYGVMPVVNDLIASGEWRMAYLALHPLMYCDVAITRAA